MIAYHLFIYLFVGSFVCWYIVHFLEKWAKDWLQLLLHSPLQRKAVRQRKKMCIFVDQMKGDLGTNFGSLRQP